MQKKVLVIIVTFNGKKWIRECVGSVLSSSYPADIMVIDNCSGDDTLDYVPADRAVIIRNSENMGFGAANNIGLRYALAHDYDYVYLLNQDAYLAGDTLEKLIAAHAKSPEYGLLSPVQFNADGRVDYQFGLRTGIKECSQTELPVRVDFVMAAHWLLAVSTIRCVGAFSPTFHHYGEDDNYIDRLYYHGLKAGVCTCAGAVHDRASRVVSKSQSSDRKCRIPIIRMSNPNFCKRWSFARSALWLCLCSFKNKSLIPVKFIPSLWRRRSVLWKNMQTSKNEGAFL